MITCKLLDVLKKNVRCVLFWLVLFWCSSHTGYTCLLKQPAHPSLAGQTSSYRQGVSLNSQAGDFVGAGHCHNGATKTDLCETLLFPGHQMSAVLLTSEMQMKNSEHGILLTSQTFLLTILCQRARCCQDVSSRQLSTGDLFAIRLIEKSHFPSERFTRFTDAYGLP